MEYNQVQRSLGKARDKTPICSIRARTRGPKDEQVNLWKRSMFFSRHYKGPELKKSKKTTANVETFSKGGTSAMPSKLEMCE